MTGPCQFKKSIEVGFASCLRIDQMQWAGPGPSELTALAPDCYIARYFPQYVLPLCVFLFFFFFY